MDNIEKVKTHGVPRSKLWNKTKKQFALKNPKVCAVCGTKKGLQLHHKVAFHTHPELELDLDNLVWLCESMDKDCHRMFGHLGNFKSINEKIDEDIKIWKKKISTRPLWNGKEWVYNNKLK